MPNAIYIVCILVYEHDYYYQIGNRYIVGRTPSKKDLMVWTEDEILHIQLNGINWMEAFRAPNGAGAGAGDGLWWW